MGLATTHPSALCQAPEGGGLGCVSHGDVPAQINFKMQKALSVRADSSLDA